MTIQKTYVVRMLCKDTLTRYVKAKGTTPDNAMHNAAQEHYPHSAYGAERLRSFKRHKPELVCAIETTLPQQSEHLFMPSKVFPFSR